MSDELQLSHLDFQMYGSEFCCGMFEIGAFNWRQNRLYGGKGDEGKKSPASVVFETFDTEVAKRLYDDVYENGAEGPGTPSKGCYLVHTTLIGGTPEFEALIQHFKDSKWKMTKFQNHNTQNTVFAFSKKFHFRALKRKFPNMYKDYDW